MKEEVSRERAKEDAMFAAKVCVPCQLDVCSHDFCCPEWCMGVLCQLACSTVVFGMLSITLTLMAVDSGGAC